MPEYLATGRNADGKKVTERVDADSADEVVKILEARGFSEIVLHTDDVGARYTKHSRVEATFTPGQYLLFRDLPAPLAGFLLVSLKNYQQGALLHLGELGLLAARRYLGWRWGALDWLLVFLLLFPALFAAFFSAGAHLFSNPLGRYRKLMGAMAWARWEEALRLVHTVGPALPPEEVAFNKAKALAALGRLDEALAVVRPFGDGRIEPWLYWSRLASVYLNINHYGEAVALYDKALELAPGNPTILIDRARVTARRLHDPRRARALLDRARQHAMSDLAQPFATQVEGLILLEEGRPREALPLLEEAYRKASAFRHASPLMESALDQMEAPLALAYAAVGETEKARRHFEHARPRLLAHRLHDDIARCEQAIGLPASG